MLKIPSNKEWPDLTEDEKNRVMEWLVETCLLFGTTRKTAYRVASEFADGLDRLAGLY